MGGSAKFDAGPAGHLHNPAAFCLAVAYHLLPPPPSPDGLLDQCDGLAVPPVHHQVPAERRQHSHTTGSDGQGTRPLRQHPIVRLPG